MTGHIKMKAYAKLIRAMLAVCSAIYELVTGDKAPPSKDVLS
jgi:hypothetical protein